MSICRSCGGVLGRDCFNEEDCMWISDQQERQREQQIEHQAYLQSEHIAMLENEIKQMKQQILELQNKK